MTDSVARIAFVTKLDTAIFRQLASGLSRFAKPDRGYILREFFIEEEAKALPPSLESWRPDAVVSFLQRSEVELLEALASSRPLVNVSRVPPLPNRAVVLSSAEEVYSLVHAHFQELGIAEVAQFVMGESLGPYSTRDRYRQFTEARGIPFRSFTIADPEERHDPQQLVRPDEALAQWLSQLKRPTGIFTQNNFAGGYLCRTCKLMGLAVPGDVAVVGADGFDAALISRPALTTLHVPGEAIGYEAGKVAAAMLEGASAPPEIVVVNGVKLIVRGSTRSRVHTDCNVDAAMDFIFKHACEGIRVNDVVSHTQGVSRMTFHKRFVQSFGKTPAEAIKERQLSEARRMVSETQLSFGAIAGMCGYCDYAHFYRTFCEAEGLGPRDYRKMLLQF